MRFRPRFSEVERFDVETIQPEPDVLDIEELRFTDSERQDLRRMLEDLFGGPVPSPKIIDISEKES